ncbi:hypothetical protein TWF718_004020 [Orbilia javanica]|uniref:Uncharacterized protein n=1 Tax=Orbilia javanica TaxID=47235 RepID=A0AAN8MX13_9PEZI
MVAYKKSTALILTTATLAAAQNGTLPYVPSEEGTHDITYTTVIPSLCPTGLVPKTYTINQHCDYAPCEKPEVPYGWEVKTKYCGEGCGPAPTYVPVTECPWENPAPTPACYGPGCYKDEVICPEGNTYTNWYHIPTPEPKPYPPPVHPEPKPYPPPVHPEPKPYPPPVHPEPKPYPPPVHPEPKPYPPSVHPVPTPAPTPYTPTTCEGPGCPGFVTKVYPPPTKPEVPCNTTVPPPPMYTGAGVKTAASGVLGFIAVAIVAFLLTPPLFTP